MLRMVAAAFEDAWAFVEVDGRLQLVRPPFRARQTSEVSRHTLEAAITSHGFSAVDINFTDWRDLVAFLWQRMEEERKEIERRTGKAAAGEIIRRATRDALRMFVVRVEGELLPRREWRVAFDILAHVMRNPELREDAELFERVVDLLDRCQEEMSRVATRREALVTPDWKGMFPAAVSAYNEEAIDEYTNTVRRRGQIMIVGTR